MRTISDSTLTAIANAVREKTGKTAALYPNKIAEEILSLKTTSNSLSEFNNIKIGNLSFSTSSTNTFTITHNLGYAPKVVIVYMISPGNKEKGVYYFLMYSSTNNYCGYFYITPTGTYYTTGAKSKSTIVTNVTNTIITFDLSSVTTNAYLSNVNSYRYIIF